ncbi:MAG TPA: glycosyltransferase [Thermoanaerobaculia bacterium]|nr:glycosyltransferase [Thermoanaerobaculia bacterium]
MAASALAPRQTPGGELLCLSHLRWDFVFQRPQQLMTRFARSGRVFFFEEPVAHDGAPALELRPRPLPGGGHVLVAVPRLPQGLPLAEAEALQRELLDTLVAEQGLADYVLWYYTPMALGFSSHLRPAVTVYDCMDELSLFRGASPRLAEREAELLARADLVFTGGQSLYEAKRGRHPRVHCLPSSIDREHFARARGPVAEPADQAPIPRPRLGYFGVIDERIDLELLAGLAAARPDWQIVMLGPLAKLDAAALPRAANLHWLGMKDYRELPAYLAGWDVALMPFAQNESTRFISPTKTPEYLAGGKPVVSTPVRDVVRPYGELGLVEIAADAAGFVAAVERLLARGEAERAAWLARADEQLRGSSWDATQRRMAELVREAADV